MKKNFLLLISVLLEVSLMGSTNDSLLHYINIALKNNPELQAKYKTYEALVEQVPQTKALPNPTLSVGYAITPIQTRQGPQDAKLSFMQMFPWMGSLKAREQFRILEAKSSYENYQTAKKKLTRYIENGWYNLYYIQKKISRTKEQIHFLETFEKQILIKFQNSNSSLLDILEVQISIENLNNQLRIIAHKKNKLLAEFNIGLNRKITDFIYIPDSLEVNDIDLTLEDQTIVNHSERNAVKLKLEAMDYKIKDVKQSNKPMLGLGLDYSFIGDDKTLPGDQIGKNTIMPIISLSIPVYRKKNKAKINEIILWKEKTEWDLKTTENTLLLDYQNAKEEYKIAIENINLYRYLIKKSQQALNIVQIEYMAGHSDIENLIRWHENLLKYEINLAESISNLYKSKANVKYFLRSE